MTQTKVHSTVTPVSHYILPATAETVHWGYFSRSLQPVLSVQSGDFVTIETLRTTPMTIMHV
jgi:acetamidase/formamidase